MKFFVRYILLLVMAAESMDVYAQGMDFGAYTTLVVAHKFSEKFTSLLRTEVQMKNNLSEMDLMYCSLQNRYRLFPWLTLEGNAEYNLRNLGNHSVRNLFRVQVGALASVKLRDVKLSTIQRGYFSLCWDKEPPRKHFFFTYYRGAYEPEHWKVFPYVSALWLIGPEVFQRQVALGGVIRLPASSSISVAYLCNHFVASNLFRHYACLSYSIFL